MTPDFERWVASPDQVRARGPSTWKQSGLGSYRADGGIHLICGGATHGRKAVMVDDGDIVWIADVIAISRRRAPEIGVDGWIRMTREGLRAVPGHIRL